MSSFYPIQTQPFSLAGAGTSIGDTTVTVSSFKQIDGTTNITMADLGTICFATIEPGNGIQEEQISFSGVSQNTNGTATLTGVRSVAFSTPYASVSGLTITHAGGVQLVLSNTSGFYSEFPAIPDNATITGLWTFPSADATRIRVTTDTDTAVPAALVSFGQLSRQAISGAANGSQLVKGIFQETTLAQIGNGTTTGSTGALLIPGNGELSGIGGTAFAIPRSNSSGVLDKTFGGLANSLAQLGTDALVVQNPTNATTVATASKIPIAGSGGKIDNAWLNYKFGGTGADGALDTSGGPVVIDLGSASYVTKNYTSINVVTNNVTFSNPASTGTFVVFRSQGDVVISATIDARNVGAAAATTASHILDSSAHFGTTGTVGSTGAGTVSGGTGGAILSNLFLYTNSAELLESHSVRSFVGSGGGNGGAGNGASPAGGAGGHGGGGLYIECGGAWNFTGAIKVDGQAGSNGTIANATAGSSAGGGGGGAGSLIALYNTLTASSGSVTFAGGIGGNGGDGIFGTNSDYTGAGGGAGGGSFLGAGGNGGTGARGFTALTSSSTVAGGTGGATNGAVGNAGASSGTGGGATDQGGGSGGGGAGHGGFSVITKNVWFF